MPVNPASGNISDHGRILSVTVWTPTPADMTGCEEKTPIRFDSRNIDAIVKNRIFPKCVVPAKSESEDIEIKVISGY
jgi:hypothetical protein